MQRGSASDHWGLGREWTRATVEEERRWWWWCCCKRVVEVEVEEEEEGDASEALGSPGIRDVETQPKLAAIGRE